MVNPNKEQYTAFAILGVASRFAIPIKIKYGSICRLYFDGDLISKEIAQTGFKPAIIPNIWDYPFVSSEATSRHLERVGAIR